MLRPDHSGGTWTSQRLESNEVQSQVGGILSLQIWIGHGNSIIVCDNRTIIDTSYLYRLDRDPNASPGLREVANVVLKTSLSPTHDSLQDANVALSLAEFVKRNGFQPPIHRNGSEENSSTLLLHRIPSSCNNDILRQIFMTAAHIVPVEIQTLQHAGLSSTMPAGKANAVFSSPKHAKLAFDSLAGPERPDKANRPQKRVYLKQGGYIYIRKY